MASPNSPALQKLNNLDTSSPNFQDQLCNTLYGKEYTDCVQGLEGGDPTWLVNYLDKVRPESPSLTRYSCQRRLSTFSNLPASLLGSVCANSGACAARCGLSQHPTRSHPTSWTFIPSRLRLEVLAMYTMGRSMVHRFVSNASGFTYRIIRRRSSKFVVDFCRIPHPPSLTEVIGLLPRGRDVETHGTPERRPPPGNHHLPAAPADF